MPLTVKFTIEQPTQQLNAQVKEIDIPDGTPTSPGVLTSGFTVVPVGVTPFNIPAATNVLYTVDTLHVISPVLNLPNNPPIGTILGICDNTGNAQTNHITVNPPAGGNFVGLNPFNINWEYSTFLIIHVGNNAWRALSVIITNIGP